MQIPWKRWAFREKVTEAHLNDLSDLINLPPRVKVRRTTTANVSANGAPLTISWEAETSTDLYSMWAIGLPTQVFIPYTAEYDLHAKIELPPMGVAAIYLRIYKNGVTLIGQNQGFSSDKAAQTSLFLAVPAVLLTAGDYLTVQVLQYDTVTRALQVTNDGTWFSVKMYCAGVLGS
jgi:hypothetical protein